MAVKDFLDGELAKYETWEEVCANESIITKLVDNAKGFVKLRDQKSGQTTILKFLGGNWITTHYSITRRLQIWRKCGLFEAVFREKIRPRYDSGP